jgi:hypothetical protein
MAMSFLLISILAVRNLKTSRIFAFVPVWYVIAFLGVTRLSQFVIHPATPDHTIAVSNASANNPTPPTNTLPSAEATKSAVKKNTTPATPVSKPTTQNPKPAATTADTSKINQDSIKRQEALKLVDNNRVFSLSGTGREKMWYTFVQLFRDSGWKKFIYQNNTRVYLERKSHLPYININASTLTENSYMLLLLSTGYLGLLVFLFVFFHYFRYFLKRQAWFTILYFLLLMAVWFYEESLGFPFSMVAQLFALMTVLRFEKKPDETSIDHKHASTLQATGVE